MKRRLVELGERPAPSQHAGLRRPGLRHRQDCATGKIIDDGCSDDGRCMSCINFCPQADTPASAPPTSR